MFATHGIFIFNLRESFLPPPLHWPNSENILKWIYPFHEISCNFDLNAFLTPPPISQTVKKIVCGFIHFMKFPLMMTIVCRYVGIWDQHVVVLTEEERTESNSG